MLLRRAYFLCLILFSLISFSGLAHAADTIWVEDAVPVGAVTGGNETWTWVSSNPTPHSGSLAHQSANKKGLHQHLFQNVPIAGRLTVGTGDSLYAYVYLDPASPPSEVMLQWHDGNWEHRAYWGANLILKGTDGTNSRRYMGALPAAGQWVRLEVPASQVGLEGRTLRGMSFMLYNGRATWDQAGIASVSVPVPTVSLSANPTSVATGGSSTLSWSSTNATSCTASGAWSGSKAISGSETLANLSATGTYTLSCSGAGGTGAQSVVVTVTVVSGCTTTGATSAIALSNVPERLSGVAPLSVFFDASGTTATSTTRPFHDLEYRWDFGDPAGSPVSGTTWSTGARAGVSSRNAATGAEAAHVYETPGVYTVVLSITDGANTVTNNCTQIVVDDPEVVFAGSNTICFSTSGIYTACPAGATHVQTSDFAGAINNYKGPNRRLLFRRGETFTAASSGVLDVNGPGIIGAYGSGTSLPVAKITSNGAFPIVQVSGAATPGIGDWRIMDFDFDGSSVSSSSDISAIATSGGFDRLLSLRLNIHDIYRGVAAGIGIADWWNTHGYPGHTIFKGWSVVDSRITGLPGCNSPGNYNCDWRVYISGEQVSVQGNYLDNQDTGGSHVIRSEFMRKGVISNNTLARAGDFQLAIKLHATVWGVPGVSDPTGAGVYSEQVMIADNKIMGGINPWTLSLGPQDEISDERVRDMIVERNWFTAGSATQLHMHINSSDTTIRNNICDLTGAAYHSCVSVDRWGVAPAPANVRVYNNTFYSGSTGDFIGVEIGAASNTTIQNNLGYAPQSSGPLMISGAGTGLVQSNNSTNTQLKSTSPGWVLAVPSLPADFKLTGSSYALGAGTSVPVLSDFFLTSRTSHSLGAALQ